MKNLQLFHPVSPTREYNIDLDPGKSIRLYGPDTGRGRLMVSTDGDQTVRRWAEDPFDITFRVGDRATYDSYNLTYLGTIVSIGEKTITIAKDGYRGKTARLTLVDFAWRNCDFNLERINHENFIEMQSI